MVDNNNYSVHNWTRKSICHGGKGKTMKKSILKYFVCFQ